jgi:hypothetical protein
MRTVGWRLTFVWLALLCFGSKVWAQSPGHVYFQRLAAPDLDPWTNSPNSAQQQWFRTHFFRMGVFSPYFDARSSWYPNGLVYVNLYGLDPNSPVRREHPDWILHDARGRMLYIPFACNNGTCPHYAGDVANPSFRLWWIREMRSILSRGSYFGLWIDDVNMEFRVSDGTGNQVAPVDSSTGRLMTWDAWRNHVADFTEEIRAAFPKAEIIENPIWFAGPEPGRDLDSAIQRQIRTADNINVERGIASDGNLTGGTGKWSIHAVFDYIDRIHAAGRGVTMGEYFPNDAAKQYALAGYFLISTGNDRIGDAGTHPDNWWRGYDVELGDPLGPRNYSNGIYTRNFTGGTVLLGEPGLSAKTIPLPASFATLAGDQVSSVRLSGSQGIILIGKYPEKR